jgi:hypothetical protein
MLKVVMTRGRKLKKGGDVEAQKQNVVSSQQIIGNKMLIHYEQDLGNKMLIDQN